MPLSRYNPVFGGKKDSAAKTKAAMIKEYGAEKGESVFYATVNKRKNARGVKSNMPEHGMYKNVKGGDVGKMRQEESKKAGNKMKVSQLVAASSYFKSATPRTEK